jgi:adenylate cyclase
VVGKDSPVRIFEVLGDRGAVAGPVLQMRDRFEIGLSAYRTRDYAQARAAFSLALESVPKDACSAAFISRLDELERKPMPPDWDGVWQQSSK